MFFFVEAVRAPVFSETRREAFERPVVSHLARCRGVRAGGVLGARGRRQGVAGGSEAQAHAGRHKFGRHVPLDSMTDRRSKGHTYEDVRTVSR